MPRRPASVTQADIARAIRALRDTGVPIERIHVRFVPGGVVVEDTGDAQPPAEGYPATWELPAGIVYVIGYANWVKIGFTQGDPAKRLRDLQTGAPEQLVILGQVEGTTATERDLHLRFASYRAQGEWFRREGELAAWIGAGCLL